MIGTGAVAVLVILATGTIIAVAVIFYFIFKYYKKVESIDWELGVSYLVKEKGSSGGYALFRELLKNKDGSGIVISRTFPEKIERRDSLDAIPVWWLSREESPHSIDPMSLAKLVHVIRDFIKRKETPIIFLDGLEYLVMHNGFETTLRFLQALNDLIILNKATLIIPVDPSSFSVKQLSLLEKEMEIHRLSLTVLRFFGEE